MDDAKPFAERASDAELFSGQLQILDNKFDKLVANNEIRTVRGVDILGERAP